MSKKLLTILSVAALSGSVLAGCGHEPLHHSASVASREADQRVSNHSHCKKHTHKSKTTKTDSDKHQSESATNHSSNVPSHKTASASGAQSSTSSKPANVAQPVYTLRNSSASNGLPTVNLGHGVTGQIDRGAGQVYVGFTANGQHFITHGNDINEPANTAVNNAKGIVNNLYNK